MENKAEYRSAGWEAGEGGKISGYAIVFEQRTVLYKDPITGYEYGEIIDRHALDGADMADVILRYDHEGRVLARTRNHSLRLSVDEHGLAVEADMNGSDEARSFYNDVKAGLVDKMSFCFEVAADEWDEHTHTRRVKSISRLYDVSLVSFPAYEQTQVSARGHFEMLAEPDRKTFQEAETRAILADIETRMKKHESLNRAEPEDFMTREEVERAEQQNLGFPPLARKKIDKRDPIFREMLEIRAGWETNVEKSNVPKAQEMQNRFRQLEEELAALTEKRTQAVNAIINGEGKTTRNFETETVRKENKFMDKNMETREFYNKLVEARSAATTSTMTAVIPETILEQYIIEKTPGAFLEDATKTTIAHSGSLVIPIASLQAVEKHTENAQITTNGYVPGKLTIEHNEYAYNTGYSDLGMQVSVSNMQTIVNDTLLSSMMKKMDGICLDAVAGLTYTANTNAVELTASTAPTFADFVKLAGMLGKDFIDRAKWYMNASTFFSWLLGLQDSQKRPIFDASKLVSEQAPLGYPIRIDSQIPANVVYFGAGSCVHLNFARQPEINTWTDFEYNMQKFNVRAVAGATCETGAFVKMSVAA